MCLSAADNFNGQMIMSNAATTGLKTFIPRYLPPSSYFRNWAGMTSDVCFSVAVAIRSSEANHKPGRSLSLLLTFYFVNIIDNVNKAECINSGEWPS